VGVIGVAVNVVGVGVGWRDKGGVVGIDVHRVLGSAAVGEVPVEDKVDEGIGAQLVEAAFAAVVAGSARVRVEDSVDA
jgi:hypothetical protein